MKKDINKPAAKRKLTASRKALVFICAAVVLAAAAVGGTLMYMSQVPPTVKSSFVPAEISGEFLELADGSSISYHNTKDSIPVYVRAALIANWKDENGDPIPAAPQKDVDYSITIGSEWFEGDDGFLYRDGAVAPGETTGDLISSSTRLETEAPNGCHLVLEILMQTIQAEPADAVESAWGFVPGAAK